MIARMLYIVFLLLMILSFWLLGNPWPPDYKPRPDAWERLTDYQRVIVALVAGSGMSNAEVAARLGDGVTAVGIKKALTRAYGTIGLSGGQHRKRILMVRWAWSIPACRALMEARR